VLLVSYYSHAGPHAHSDAIFAMVPVGEPFSCQISIGHLYSFSQTGGRNSARLACDNVNVVHVSPTECIVVRMGDASLGSQTRLRGGSNDKAVMSVELLE
jgi:hypothetical protein